MYTFLITQVFGQRRHCGRPVTVGGQSPGSSAAVAKYLIALPGRANHRDPV